jgi:hypothetical protein
MVVQIILMLIGFTSDDAFSAGDGIDIDGDGIPDFDAAGSEGVTTLGLKIISVRTVIAFLCIGSFTAFTAMEVGVTAWWAALLIGCGAGLVAGFLMGLAISALARMHNSGNIDIKNCVGKEGEVYLTVPASRSFSGKVNVLVQERLTEFEAVTDSAEPIKTGSQVMVTSVVNEHLLLVEPLTSGVKSV